MEKIELLAPAGDLEKLNIAYLYGADAVYIGGYLYSLRSRAVNFNEEELKQACYLAHEVYHKKLYVTLNVYPKTFDQLKEYLIFLQAIGIDALICASLSIIKLVNSLTKIPLHLSTQVSTTNSYVIKYYEDYQISRVVLARELSLRDIRSITNFPHQAQLEVFIHGAMCSSYSGRCSLSYYLSGRDANLGACAHCCRWEYHLFNDKYQQLSPYYFSLASKDLCGLKSVKKLQEMGINSLKIEGRMKSLYYIGIVVRTYRLLIDEIFSTKKVKSYQKYFQELASAQNRSAFGGFLTNSDEEMNIYDLNQEPNQRFIAILKKYLPGSKSLFIEQRNNFKVGEIMEIITPQTIITNIKVCKIINLQGEQVASANHPQELLNIQINKIITQDIMENCFIRRKSA